MTSPIETLLDEVAALDAHIGEQEARVVRAIDRTLATEERLASELEGIHAAAEESLGLALPADSIAEIRRLSIAHAALRDRLASAIEEHRAAVIVEAGWIAAEERAETIDRALHALARPRFLREAAERRIADLAARAKGKELSGETGRR